MARTSSKLAVASLPDSKELRLEEKVKQALQQLAGR
jgi:hypothetical protein